MSQDQLLLLLFKVAVIAVEAASMLWIAVYTYLARWWANPLGVTVTRLAILLAASLVPSVLSLFFHLNRGTSRAVGWFDVALLAAVALELFRRVPLWVKLHLTEQGEHSYAGMRTFARQVIRRRGRPVWKDRPAPGTGGEPPSPP